MCVFKLTMKVVSIFENILHNLQQLSYLDEEEETGMCLEYFNTWTSLLEYCFFFFGITQNTTEMEQTFDLENVIDVTYIS